MDCTNSEFVIVSLGYMTENDQGYAHGSMWGSIGFLKTALHPRVCTAGSWFRDGVRSWLKLWGVFGINPPPPLTLEMGSDMRAGLGLNGLSFCGLRPEEMASLA